jgi:hypothetical protein
MLMNDPTERRRRYSGGLVPQPASINQDPAAEHLSKNRQRNIWSHIDGFVRRFEPWGILLALIAFYFDFSNRAEQRTVASWQLLTEEASGNSGKIGALEHLNSDDGLVCTEALRGWIPWRWRDDRYHCIFIFKKPTPLAGVDLSPPRNDTYDQGLGIFPETYLLGVDLPRADLQRANLRQTAFQDAVLKGANLRGANLTDAVLQGANLSGSDLRNAEVRGASFVGTNLTGAKMPRLDLSGSDMRGAALTSTELLGANLSGVLWTGAILQNTYLWGANLQGARQLQPSQLKNACGDETTKLPDGFKLQRCKPLAAWRRERDELLKDLR